MSTRSEPTFQVVDAVPDYYSNVLRITSGAFGVTVLFGIARPVGLTGDAISTEPVCAVHMSPTHAKVLVKLLEQQLHEYETRFGKIPMPQETQAGENR